MGTRKQTFYQMQTRFFILGANSAVDREIDRCLRCQIDRKRPQTQRMGELPSDRLQMVCPFSVSGMDLMGPFAVRHGGRGTCKRWILIVTCFVSRAVCLIPVIDLSGPTIINALVKMNAQFPSLKKIYSDNAPNFKYTDTEIKKAVNSWNLKLMRNCVIKRLSGPSGRRVVGVTAEFGRGWWGCARS